MIVTVVGRLKVGEDLASKRRQLMGFDDGMLAHRPYPAEVQYLAFKGPHVFGRSRMTPSFRRASPVLVRLRVLD